MAAATYVINWKSGDKVKTPVTIKTEPESIYTGDAITIKLFSAVEFDLISPYKGLGAKRVAIENKSITETIDLNGSQDIATEYPIKSISSMVAAVPLVDELTRSVVINVDSSAIDYISVVNQKLTIKESVKLHGSITIHYETFNAQIWQHQSFAKKCNALLFAQNSETGEYQNVPLTINERSNSASQSIRIEAWTSQPKRGFNPYHAVIIYPASKQYAVVTDYGSVKFIKKVSHIIKGEELNFNGKEASTSYPIKSLGKLTGIFHDANLNKVQPSFRLSDGVIKSNMECFGFGVVEYTTEGLVYDYNADVTIQEFPTHLTTIRIGYIIAQEIGKVGIGASYKVPVWQNSTIQRIDFYKVRRKVLTVSNGTFEYPPNWDGGDNTYPNQPTAPDQRPLLDDKGSNELVWGEVVEVGWTDISGSIDYDLLNNRFYDPYSGSADNPDASYYIDVNIPSDIVDTYLIDKMNERITKTKEYWGIA